LIHHGRSTTGNIVLDYIHKLSAKKNYIWGRYSKWTKDGSWTMFGSGLVISGYLVAHKEYIYRIVVEI
jgi:hypothetical protein